MKLTLVVTKSYHIAINLMTMLKDVFLFEISWEVCNKVGGIYTVITTKSNQILKKIKNYYCVGPYLQNSNDDFIEIKTPNEYIEIKSELLKLGINIYFGKWKANEKVNVILIEYKNFSYKINDIKAKLWEEYKIDSLGSNWYDYDEPILWSWACGILIDKIYQKTSKKTIIHAHEWMSGGAIFYNKINQNKNIKTVFTTHATMLGRTISGHGEDLYKNIKDFFPNEKAYELGIHTKHQSEKTLASISDCFTTVSNITDLEAKYFYNKEADTILYNGFDNTIVGDINRLNKKLENSRKDLDEFTKAYFNDFINIDTNNVKYFFTSGRNEFRNKGVDIYIKSLAKINSRIKNTKIINFILILIGNFEKNSEITKSFENYKYKLKKEDQKNAPLSTHNIPENNDIIKALKENNLNNSPNDNVLNIVIPTYISTRDNLINKTYYDFTSAFDLGVFPSNYEPWGYTPLECISLAIPTVTSDLSGFGQSVLNHCGDACTSVKVIRREKVNDEKSIESLSKFLIEISEQTKRELDFHREITKTLAIKYDWEVFINRYLEAYEIALKK